MSRLHSVRQTDVPPTQGEALSPTVRRKHMCDSFVSFPYVCTEPVLVK